MKLEYEDYLKLNLIKLNIDIALLKSKAFFQESNQILNPFYSGILELCIVFFAYSEHLRVYKLLSAQQFRIIKRW